MISRDLDSLHWLQKHLEKFGGDRNALYVNFWGDYTGIISKFINCISKKNVLHFCKLYLNVHFLKRWKIYIVKEIRMWKGNYYRNIFSDYFKNKHNKNIAKRLLKDPKSLKTKKILKEWEKKRWKRKNRNIHTSY